MKPSLWKELIRYGKTKGRAPLDERQMDTLKNQYMELAKSVLLSFMIFLIAYGYKEIYGKESNFRYMDLAVSLLGALTYYYLLRFCYKQVIGIDETFDVLVIPALLFTPFLYMNALFAIGYYIQAPKLYFQISTGLLPLFAILNYLGANRVYQRGKIAVEQEVQHGELHFRSRKQIVNYLWVIIIILSAFPIPYEHLFRFSLIAGALFMTALIWYYGFHDPQNLYILNEQGLIYHKALWNRKGGFLPYESIEWVKQQDTFNIGYAKDKVCIHLRDGSEILLYPENAYRFCTELENNL